MNATRQSLNTDKEKKTVFAFISTNFLFTRSSAAVNVFMFVRPRRLRLRCEEPGSVHGSPLAAVLRCVVEAASLNRVYLRDGGSERRDAVGSSSILTASLNQSFVTVKSSSLESLPASLLFFQRL